MNQFARCNIVLCLRTPLEPSTLPPVERRPNPPTRRSTYLNESKPDEALSFSFVLHYCNLEASLTSIKLWSPCAL